MILLQPLSPKRQRKWYNMNTMITCKFCGSNACYRSLILETDELFLGSICDGCLIKLEPQLKLIVKSREWYYYLIKEIEYNRFTQRFDSPELAKDYTILRKLYELAGDQ